MQEWEAGVKAEITEAEELLGRDGLGTRARTMWQSKLANKKRELEQKDARVTIIEKDRERADVHVRAADFDPVHIEETDADAEFGTDGDTKHWHWYFVAAQRPA